jgi:hypothetical protein
MLWLLTWPKRGMGQDRAVGERQLGGGRGVSAG